MSGSIKTYTPNFKMIIPEFNVATWHDYVEENFRSIDALFHNLFGINGFSGMWKTNSQYTDGQVLFIGEDNDSIYEGRLVKVVNDTNTGGFATFSEAIKTNPKDYELYADASSAQIFSELARDWANKTDGTIKTPEGDDTGEYSAKHYQTLAKGNEEQCEMFKNLSNTNAQLAQDAANSAETSAQNSETSAQNALVSEQNSKTSETNAKTSEDNALSYKNSAQSSASSAQTSAQNAENSATIATNAANSSNVQTVVTNISAINNCSTNMFAIKDAPKQAESARLSAEAAASSAAVSNPPPILTHSWEDHILNDIRYLRADTFSWQDGEMYKSAYNHLVDDFTGTTSATETVGSHTITYYLAEDGHKIVLPDMEATVQNIYNESGTAWYYILDVDNQRFKLPRGGHGNIVEKYNSGTEWYRVYSDGWCEQGGVLGTESTTRGQTINIVFVKDFINTDYTVFAVDGNTSKSTYSASVSIASVLNGTKTISGVSISSYGFASGDSDVHGVINWQACGYVSSAPDNSQYKYLYFYVGNYTQPAIEQTAGLNAELFNGKMDLDAGNVTQTAKETIIGWGMPDYSAEIDIKSSVVSVDGYTCVSCGQCFFRGNSNSNLTIIINGKTVMVSSTPTGFPVGFAFNVDKGDVIKGNNVYSAQFFPLKGVN